MFLVSCSAGRWTVADQQAVDLSEEPDVLERQTILLADQFPTVENPVIGFSAYDISTKEYTHRVQVERTIQKYRPRGVFLITTLAGAAFSFIAANTDAMMPSATVSQKVAMNMAGGVLGVLSVMNLEPTGEPIETGESRLIRKSGTEVVQDTTQSLSTIENTTAEVSVSFHERVIFSQKDVELTGNKLEINLGAFAEELEQPVDKNSEIAVELSFAGSDTREIVPVKDFLSEYVTVTTPIAMLRSSPEITDNNIVTEVGEGSQLELLAEETGSWYRVRYNESEVFLQQNSGDIEWISTFDSGPALLVEFAEVPFGEIDVERFIPVLKTPAPADRGLILTNSGNNNHIGSRQYLGRDHRLFRQYLERAFQIHENRVQEYENDDPDDWAEALSDVSPMHGEGLLLVNLTGFATIHNNELMLVHQDEGDALTRTPFRIVFEALKNANPGKVVIFVDVSYQREGVQYQNGPNSNGYRTVMRQLADVILNDLPESAVIFSNMPGQQSSLYTSQADGNKRHHIFNYFLAEALQQRKTRISDLIQHLQNNVDYTSRRLHDQPQEVRAFGNMSLNLAE